MFLSLAFDVSALTRRCVSNAQVLFEGDLLRGDMPLPPIEDCFVVGPDTDPMEWVTVQGMDNCTLPDNRQPYESYRFWAGSQSVAVFVRALPDQSKYVVAGKPCLIRTCIYVYSPFLSYSEFFVRQALCSQRAIVKRRLFL